MSANVKRSEKTLICVVDDDFLLRESTTRLLRSFKFNVKALASAEEFLNSERLAETACLILDVRIPGMSGLELQHQLAADHSDVPIIFITAHEDESCRRQALQAGAVAFLHKPFYEQELLKAIDAALKDPGDKHQACSRESRGSPKGNHE
jgi:FixJ family two-component response regulator